LAEDSKVRINEIYRNYKPPVNVARVVHRLLTRVPDQYTRGLGCIVLTDLAGQPRRNRLGKTISRGRRIHKSRVAGLYHEKWKGQSPWIELYIDQILRPCPRWILWVPFFRDFAIANTLYHELGHHVHLFISPEYREKEDVADEWRKKFMANFIRQEYWYLAPVSKMWRVFRRKGKTPTRG
jgi:hypothetical protein